MLIFVHDTCDHNYTGFIIDTKEVYQNYSSFLTYIVNYTGYINNMHDDFNSYRKYGNIYRTGDEYLNTSVQNDKWYRVPNLATMAAAIIQYQYTDDNWLNDDDYAEIKDTAENLYDNFLTHDKRITIIRDNGDYFYLYDTMGEDQSKWMVPKDFAIQYICETLFDIFNNFDYNTEFDTYIAKLRENAKLDETINKDRSRAFFREAERYGKVEDYEARQEYMNLRRIVDQ